MPSELEDIKQEILSKALLFLAYRPRSVQEVTKRLDKYFQSYKGLTQKNREELTEAVMRYLNDNKLLNDGDFSKLYIESKSRGTKALGKRAILQRLVEKGVNKNEASEYVDAAISPEEESALALKALRKKYHLDGTEKNNGITREVQEKMGRYLMSRGFSYSIARQAVDYLLKGP